MQKINSTIISNIKTESDSNLLSTSRDLELSSYDFMLPNELIATSPIMPKEAARLLVYNNGNIIHSSFKDLFNFIPKDYLIVLNNTKVIRARLFAKKLILESFVKNRITKSCTLPKSREVFYHKMLEDNLHMVQIRGKANLYDVFVIEWNNVYVYIQVLGITNDGFREVIFFTLNDCSLIGQSKVWDNINILTQSQVFNMLEECGIMPLPSYIKRESTKKDDMDYQSIFAKHSGSVAAPTASLHFSESMFETLQQYYKHAFVTLHVGAGTFKPVSSANILEHTMHKETCVISKENIEKIIHAEKLLCVGTTAMRSVEWLMRQQSFGDFGDIDSLIGENNIFLHPYNPPKKVKALLTNFHLPKSSLIMLVSSMVGRKETFKIYNEAIKHGYRFYSYGDGMLII